MIPVYVWSTLWIKLSSGTERASHRSGWELHYIACHYLERWVYVMMITYQAWDLWMCYEAYDDHVEFMCVCPMKLIDRLAFHWAMAINPILNPAAHSLTLRRRASYLLSQPIVTHMQLPVLLLRAACLVPLASCLFLLPSSFLPLDLSASRPLNLSTYLVDPTYHPHSRCMHIEALAAVSARLSVLERPFTISFPSCGPAG